MILVAEERSDRLRQATGAAFSMSNQKPPRLGIRVWSSRPARLATSRRIPWWVTMIRMPRPTCSSPRANASSNRASTRVRCFTTRRRAELASSPRCALGRPAGLDFVASQALPRAAVAFAKPGFGQHGRFQMGADDLRGALRPSEIGRVDHARDDPRIRELAAPRGCLLFTLRRQRCIEPTLPAALDVPGRRSVANDEDASHGR